MVQKQFRLKVEIHIQHDRKVKFEMKFFRLLYIFSISVRVCMCVLKTNIQIFSLLTNSMSSYIHRFEMSIKSHLSFLYKNKQILVKQYFAFSLQSFHILFILHSISSVQALLIVRRFSFISYF